MAKSECVWSDGTPSFACDTFGEYEEGGDKWSCEKKYTYTGKGGPVSLTCTATDVDGQQVVCKEDFDIKPISPPSPPVNTPPTCDTIVWGTWIATALLPDYSLLLLPVSLLRWSYAHAQHYKPGATCGVRCILPTWQPLLLNCV